MPAPLLGCASVAVRAWGWCNIQGQRQALARASAADGCGRTEEPGVGMSNGDLTWITNFIWGIADDVLRDLYVRGKYRDVILPMVVLRRLDAVLEPTKQAVMDMKAALDKAGITNQDRALRQAAGQAFYNTSPFSLRDLRARASQQQLRADFEAYLNGFSPNVQEILDSFEFRNQIPRLSRADALGDLIEKLLDRSINLSPEPVKNSDGSIRLPGLDNHAMGTIFEELVRRFNEENNEEAGEHWTPRDAVKLMAKLIILPIANQVESGTYLLYDGACGTGGMLTVAEEALHEVAKAHGKEVATHLYGQEVNAETYAIAKADFLLKGEGEAADNLVGGPEWSTLSNDAFPAREFDFMLSNPPYGKSWKSDLERMGGKAGIRDSRFVIEHGGDPEYSLVTRSSDGQMMFLANLLSKMKSGTKLGSRVAEVHNGSSLFTGDAGQGESNIRRWIIENDWLEAIVALPMNMFYNTGIATYVWVVSNRKPSHRRGKVQLIDATAWFRPLRKNLGKKNCELAEEHIDRIVQTFLAFEETEQSRIFDNDEFGYWKVTVERPLRAAGIDPDRAYTTKEIKALKDEGRVAEDGTPVIRRIHQPGKATADPLLGRFPATIRGKPCVVEYEPDSELRDTESVPLKEPGGIEAFIRREVLPHAPDAWIDPEKTETGYEISFTRYFYKPQPLRSLDEIRADIVALERETGGLLAEIVGAGR
jgi:type I restriction enzyme M protein